MNKLLDPKNLDLLFNYQKGFDALNKTGEAIHFGDSKFRISDLFFMYNLIVNKDRFGSDRLTRLLSNYVQDINSVAKDYYQFYSDIDSRQIPLFDENMPLDKKMKEAIEFGILNTNGILKTRRDSFQEGEIVEGPTKSLPNPNFNLVTAVNTTAVDYVKNNALRTLLKYVQNNNLLIQFNCG